MGSSKTNLLPELQPLREVGGQTGIYNRLLSTANVIRYTPPQDVLGVTTIDSVAGAFIRRKVVFEEDRISGKKFGLICGPCAEAAQFFSFSRPFADGAGPVANQRVLGAGEGNAEGGGVAVFEL